MPAMAPARLTRLLGLALLGILGPSCNETGLTVTHGGGGGSSANQGWITVTSPTSDSTYWTDEWSITLGGSAFIDAWSYSGEVAPSVQWTNTSAGVSGIAIDDVTWGVLFGSVFPVERKWWAKVPLVGGTNLITVSAASGSSYATRTLKVKRPSG